MGKINIAIIIENKELKGGMKLYSAAPIEMAMAIAQLEALKLKLLLAYEKGTNMQGAVEVKK